MSKARCRPIFRTMAMGAAMVAFTGAASADDLLATLSLDMSPETAWPIAPASTDESVTADSSAPAPVIPPACGAGSGQSAGGRIRSRQPAGGGIRSAKFAHPSGAETGGANPAGAAA